MFHVYGIFWLNISITGAHGDPELGKEILNLPRLTRSACCAFESDFQFVYLSFMSYIIGFFYSL
jgi:hypothetical protein